MEGTLADPVKIRQWQVCVVEEDASFGSCAPLLCSVWDIGGEYPLQRSQG